MSLAGRSSMAPMASANAPTPASRPTTPAPWRTQLGKESRLPNLYYGAISPGSLRRLSTFTALPPPEQLCMGPWEGVYRYVRQDSGLWATLHGGRLTTSRLKDALGLRDRTAARLVGGPQAAEEGVSKAYHHLVNNPLYTPAVAAPAAAPGAVAVAGAALAGEGPPPPPARDEAEAVARNEEARLRYNAQLRAAVAEAEAAGRPLPLEPGWDEADRRRISELAALAVGASGGSRMRLLWGTLQESAAVATVGLLFPGSQLEEVGLVCLTDTSRWGVDASELPPLGASPDALITHFVPVTHEDIEAARTALTASGSRTSSDAAAAAAAQAVASQLLRTALERHTQQAVAAWAEASPSGPTTAAQAASAGSSSGGSSGNGSGSSSGQAPPLHCNTTEEAEVWLVQELLRRPASLSAATAAATASPVSSSGSSDGSSTGGGVAAVVRIREVVEVKNHCPFVYKDQRKARKRGVVINYAAADRGPVSGLWPLWVPQLQAHMAAAGASSALLLSRSPSRGVRLFRVYRDDQFLASAWELVRELQASHVVRRVPPGPDPWSGRPGYGGLIERVVGLATGAQVVVETRGTPLLAGADPDAFWKLR
ncbi:hypothetical protein HYH02_006589 [Chlamydomonas schloesseri]|uniref:Uncharacterized protein n=1 Tax=Chlamydomonas schloesseri TaxID=2026947 RepID=A0A835W3C7_9CHLO|nr:hypothetical protein HYH02_006589 [Chlamydomonas schloesseri]|eukprot:KAG2439062.1 hypothetical protein HYH02_006589 [Chlamydomonas schloesseri]